jgi:hypothetical protein
VFLDEQEWFDRFKKAYPEIKNRAQQCPECLMAALRQYGIPLPAVAEVFNFTEWMKQIWSDFNEKERY